MRSLMVFQCHRLLLLQNLLIFTAYLHIYINKVDAAWNETSVQKYVMPSPSVKRPSREAVQRHTEAIVSPFYSDISNNAMRTNFKTAAAGLVSNAQITRLNNGSSFVGQNTEKAENQSHVREDKSVVFYKRIGGWITLGIVITALSILIVTHFSSIRLMNRNEQIMEPFCSISRKAQPV